MEVLQARIDSFKKTKRIKNPNKPSSSTTVKWPHPLDFKANPETLADAGFFYNPSYEGPDSVTCYVCDKELEGWEEDDDPHVIHWKKCGQTCCWAIVRCGLLNDMNKSNRFIFTDKTRAPTHKSMEKARFDTFNVGKGWIHDQVKNHGANSKMMARAGFVYTPQQSDDDLVTCLYCDTSLSGWDADDDPMEEHRRRAKMCPFFSVTVSEPINKTRSQSQSSKPPSKSKPPTRSTSKSKHQDILLPTKIHDGDPDNDSDSSQSIAKATTKTPRKGRSTRKSSAKTPKSRTRSSSKSSLKKVKEEEEQEQEPEDHKIPPKSSRTRSKAKVIESEPEEPSATIRPRSTSRMTSRSKSKAPPEPLEGSESEVATLAPKKTSAESEHQSQTTVTSRSRSKAPPESQFESDVATMAPKKASAESKHQSHTPANLFSDDVIIENHIPPPSFSSSTRPEMVNRVMYPAPSTPQRPLPQSPPKVITPPPETIPSMDVEPEMVNHMYSAPSTLQPQAVITPPPKTAPSTAVESIPALSKLPITPLHTLTEAELDMTVEEWVRYQMDVEYDKFRRDGERELQRFRSQAEEVRKAIEGL